MGLIKKLEQGILIFGLGMASLGCKTVESRKTDFSSSEETVKAESKVDSSTKLYSSLSVDYPVGYIKDERGSKNSYRESLERNVKPFKVLRPVLYNSDANAIKIINSNGEDYHLNSTTMNDIYTIVGLRTEKIAFSNEHGYGCSLKIIKGTFDILDNLRLLDWALKFADSNGDKRITPEESGLALKKTLDKYPKCQ